MIGLWLAYDLSGWIQQPHPPGWRNPWILSLQQSTQLGTKKAPKRTTWLKWRRDGHMDGARICQNLLEPSNSMVSASSVELILNQSTWGTSSFCYAVFSPSRRVQKHPAGSAISVVSNWWAICHLEISQKHIQLLSYMPWNIFSLK